jgi:predicted RNA-binding protein with PUA-like domain
MSKKRQYWLMKSEPDAFSWQDLLDSPSKTTFWDGVRNYQARNTMRDLMKKGDGVLFYHSRTKPPGVVGVAQVVREGAPDVTQFDAKAKYFDVKASPETPRWFGVEIKAVGILPQYVSLEDIKDNPELDDMPLVQKGQRLSVQAVGAEQWRLVLEMGGWKGRTL